MFVITLAPLTALPQPSDQLLHYFSQKKVLPGQLVEIVLNKRTLLGVVFACNAADKMRIAIKNSPYPLKGISSVAKTPPLFSPLRLQFALWLSSYYYASLGVILQAMLRPLGLKPDGLARVGLKSTSKKLPALSAQGVPGTPCAEDDKKQPGPTPAFFMGDFPTQQYRDLLSCAPKKQTLVLVPERGDIEIQEKIIRELAPAADVRSFHAGMKISAQRAIAHDALTGMPIVVIGTRSALFLPFQNLSAIIVENPSNPSHTSWDQNPHVNASRAALWICQNSPARLLFHEQNPRIELLQYARINNWHIQDLQAKDPPRGTIVDMRNELKAGSRSILSKYLQGMLSQAKEKNETVFLFVQRRGFASGIVCRDCGFIILCASCSVPMVYHDQAGKKFLLCHRCQARTSAPTVCPSCHGNRIRFIGAGTERVEEEVKKMFPHLSVCRVDSDAERSDEFLKNMQKSPTQSQDTYDVIVGTAYALDALPSQSVDTGAIITIDGLLSLPDYRSSERVYEIIEKMKQATRREYLIQTYCPEAPIFASAITGGWDTFAKKELGLRKILKWPPYAHIIRMQYAHAQAATAQTQAHQALHLLQTQIQFLHRKKEGTPECEILGPSPAYVDKVENKYVWNLILKWPVNEQGNAWNLDVRNRLLAVLPRGWDIDVDPIDLV